MTKVSLKARSGVRIWVSRFLLCSPLTCPPPPLDDGSQAELRMGGRSAKSPNPNFRTQKQHMGVLTGLVDLRFPQAGFLTSQLG